MDEKKISLEIIAFSLEAARAAARSGADRLELCSGPAEGGTTPNYSLIESVCAVVAIPVFPIIRPSGGGFCYTSAEFGMMKRDIEVCKQLGCKGVTFSILLPDNRVDVARTAELVALASPMEVTFVRGFDITPDPMEALEAIKQTGCTRILTSGQAPKAADAAELLRRLVDAAGDDISVMPGSGVNAANLASLIETTGAREFHSSARMAMPNGDPLVDRFGFGNRIGCDEAQVREMRAIADRY